MARRNFWGFFGKALLATAFSLVLSSGDLKIGKLFFLLNGHCAMQLVPGTQTSKFCGHPLEADPTA